LTRGAPGECKYSSLFLTLHDSLCSSLSKDCWRGVLESVGSVCGRLFPELPRSPSSPAPFLFESKTPSVPRPSPAPTLYFPLSSFGPDKTLPPNMDCFFCLGFPFSLFSFSSPESFNVIFSPGGERLLFVLPPSNFFHSPPFSRKGLLPSRPSFPCFFHCPLSLFSSWQASHDFPEKNLSYFNHFPFPYSLISPPPPSEGAIFPTTPGPIPPFFFLDWRALKSGPFSPPPQTK